MKGSWQLLNGFLSLAVRRGFFAASTMFTDFRKSSPAKKVFETVLSISFSRLYKKYGQENPYQFISLYIHSTIHFSLIINFFMIFCS